MNVQQLNSSERPALIPTRRAAAPRCASRPSVTYGTNTNVYPSGRRRQPRHPRPAKTQPTLALHCPSGPRKSQGRSTSSGHPPLQNPAKVRTHGIPRLTRARSPISHQGGAQCPPPPPPPRHLTGLPVIARHRTPAITDSPQTSHRPEPAPSHRRLVFNLSASPARSRHSSPLSHPSTGHRPTGFPEQPPVWSGETLWLSQAAPWPAVPVPRPPAGGGGFPVPVPGPNPVRSPRCPTFPSDPNDHRRDQQSPSGRASSALLSGHLHGAGATVRAPDRSWKNLSQRPRAALASPDAHLYTRQRGTHSKTPGHGFPTPQGGDQYSRRPVERPTSRYRGGRSCLLYDQLRRIGRGFHHPIHGY